MQSLPARLILATAMLDTPALCLAQGDMLAFVGEKISLVPIVRTDQKSGVFTENLPDGRTQINLVQFDPAVQADYRIVQLVAGNFAGSQISFTAYDHMGYFTFAHYAHVLMFVQRDKERWVQKKYQFFPVFQLRSGEWAACGAAEAGLAARPLDFGPDAFFVIDKEFASRYAAPWFDLRDGRAICQMGNTVDELTALKKAQFERAK